MLAANNIVVNQWVAGTLAGFSLLIVTAGAKWLHDLYAKVIESAEKLTSVNEAVNHKEPDEPTLVAYVKTLAEDAADAKVDRTALAAKVDLALASNMRVEAKMDRHLAEHAKASAA